MILTNDWSCQLRARASSPACRSARTALAAAVDGYRNSLPSVPDRQAGYYHDYFCSEHAVQLVFDTQNPHHHRCPLDDRIYSGEPFDSAWRWFVNDVLSDAALRSAFQAFLDDGRMTAGRNSAASSGRLAAGILSNYAARYTSLPALPGTNPSYPGVVTWSGLDESVWILRLAWAYLFMEETLEHPLKSQLCEALFRPALEHLTRIRWPEIHNVTNWNNAALITLALLLGERELADQFLYDSCGLRAQLEQGVLADGLWWEGSLSYHYYTLAALVWTLRLLRATDMSFEDDGVVRRMFLTPVQLSFPDLSLPSLNDCWHFIGLTGELGHGIPHAAAFYESAYAWYGEPLFAWILNENYRRRPRSSIEVLLDGAETIEAVKSPVLPSRHFRASGLAVLRSQPCSDMASTLILKAGPSGGVHGHPDQLSIQLFSQGSLLTADLGTPGYGIPLSPTWYQQTISHSTVLLDAQPQPPATGRFHDFRLLGQAAMAAAAVAWEAGPYAGVAMRRIICWQPEYFLDVFFVRCPSMRRIGWVYHNRGACSVPAGEPVKKNLPFEGDFPHVELQSAIELEQDLQLRWQLGQARLDGLLLRNDRELLLFGKAPSNPASREQAVIIRQRQGSAAVFLTVFSPAADDGTSVVERTECASCSSGHRVTVQTQGRSDHWTIPGEEGTVSLTSI